MATQAKTKVSGYILNYYNNARPHYYNGGFLITTPVFDYPRVRDVSHPLLVRATGVKILLQQIF